MNRVKIARYIAIVATVLSIAGLVMRGTVGSEYGNIFTVMGILVRVASLMFGGFGTVTKVVESIAKWGGLL